MTTDLVPTAHFASLMEQADVLAHSNIVPKQFRGKPGDVVVAILLGQELGLGPMATMSLVDVIEGNATLNAEGKVCLVRRAGHSITGEATATKAYAHGRRSDTGDEVTVEWTIQMAQRASLANKAVWKQYPEAMLWSRAVSQLCRMLFSDVLAGVSYTPEEVESFSGIDTAEPPSLAGEFRAIGPVADPETGEIVAIPTTSTLRPPPGQLTSPCPEQPCDFMGENKQHVALHLVHAHGWTESGGKVHPPSPVSADPPSVGAGPSPSGAPAGDTDGASGGGVPSTTGAPSNGPSPKQLGLIHSTLKKLGVPEDDKHRFCSALIDLTAPVSSLSDLDGRETRALIDALLAEEAAVSA